MAEAQDLGSAFVDLPRVQIPQETIDSVPKELAHRLRVLPVKRDMRNVWMAIDQPTQRKLQALREIAQRSKCRVIPVVASPAALGEAIERYYGP